MSERITWERCPCCGAEAAVGWTRDRAVEFDCVRNCGVPSERAVRILEAAGRR